MLPNFLGLGAARSGSTWIARNLLEHPDVFVPRKKELHFFDRHYQEDLGAYEQEFAGASGQKAIGEITPQYFHNESVTPLIGRHLPDVSMFVSLRNPVDRAYSHYWRIVAMSESDNNPSFEEFLKLSDDVLEVGYYHKHLMRFYKYFQPEQIKVLFYEDLRDRPAEFITQILEFLEVEAYTKDVLVHQRVNAAASLKGLAKSENLWFLDRLSKRLGLHSLTAKIEKINRSQIPPMNPETRSWLVSHYAESNRRLEELLGRDLSDWYVASKTEPMQ